MFLQILFRLQRWVDAAIDGELATADALRRDIPRDPFASPPVAPSAPAPSAPVEPAPPAPSAWVGGTHATVVAGEVGLVEVGEQKHADLVDLWIKNWRVEGAPQPDRLNALMAAYTGWLRPWREYIRDRGGLVQATRDVLVRRHLCAVEDALPLGRAIAMEMAAVGSTANIPVDGFLEASLFSDPHGTPRGGCVADSTSMERPSYF